MNAPHPKHRNTWLPYAVGALVLWVVTAGYYQPYFSRAASWALGGLLTGLVGAHLLAGRWLFRPANSLSYGKVTALVVVFVTFRWCWVYFLLRHFLPPSTVFHYPARALWFIVPSSTVLVLAGYGLAQYRYLHRRERKTTENEPAAILRFRSEGKEIRLPVVEVRYVRARGEYIVYHCGQDRLTRFQRLKEAAVELAPHNIVRIHRSYLVARGRIRRFDTRTVELDDGTELPVSRSYRAAVKELTDS